MCVLHVRCAGGVCDETADEAGAAVSSGASLSQGKTAILTRCNLSVFREAVRLTDANPQCRIHFIGVSQCVCTTDTHKKD